VMVRPMPEKSAIAWVCCRNLEAVSEALDRLNVSETRPIAVELLNAPAALEISKDRGLPTGDLVLAVAYEENAPTVTWQLDRLKTELKNADFTIVGEEETGRLWASLIGFQASVMGPVSFVANVRPSSVVSFVARLNPSVWAVQTHAGNGIVRAHLRADSSLNSTTALIGEIRRAAVADGGNLVLSRCPAQWKEPLRVWGEPRADWAISERVKAALDPHHAMNPGRFVGRI
jgi:glycolate oxidase FAD binding subunit